MAKVSILKRNGDYTEYSNYADARGDAVAGDLIQIWANLDERILLKNEVDIWVAPGVTLDRTGATVTILDKEDSNTDPLKCKIYGYGKIKNSYTATSARYECIMIISPNTELELKCDSVVGLGSTILTASSIHITKGKKFHLTCSKVINEKSSAIYLGATPGNPTDTIDDIYIDVEKVEITSTDETSVESIAMPILGSGFIKIDELSCNHFGHALMIARGSITATIRKISTITNHEFGGGVVIVAHGGNFPNQKLILYFDEVVARKYESVVTAPGIQVEQGTAILIGRKALSVDSPAIYFSGSTTKGYINCNEIISVGGGSSPVQGLEIDNFTDQIIIDSNYIQGWKDNGVIFSNGANALINNARLKNTYTDASPSSVGILVTNANGTPNITLNNVKIIVGNTTDGKTIYYAPSGSVIIRNYGLFANKAVDESKVNLKIGTGFTPPEEYNYQYIVSLDLE